MQICLEICSSCNKESCLKLFVTTKIIECRENLLTNPEILRILKTVKFHEQK